MTLNNQLNYDIPDTILDYLAHSANVIWQKKVHPLPHWFTMKEASPVNAMAHDSLLALIKARAEGYITVRLDPDWSEFWQTCEPGFTTLGLAEEDARAQWPSIEPICRRQLLNRYKEQADEQMIKKAQAEFSKLLSPPIPVHGRFLLIEPGLKSGLKMACCEKDGQLRSHTILFPHEPQNQWQQGLRKLENCVASNRVETVIMVTGEGYRESRAFLKEWLSQTERTIQCFRLNGSYRKQLLQRYQSDTEDTLYATVDAFIPLALTPDSVLSDVNLKSLYHNPLLTIVNQASLSKALSEAWDKINGSEDSEPMLIDPLFNNPIRQLSDLNKRVTYQGQIINRTDYGYFIDIGILENGLLHNKQLPPDTTYQVGEMVAVEVLTTNPEKQQYSLTLPGKSPKPKPNGKAKRPPKLRPAANSAMADALKAALNKDN